jgi:hypothetical protein
MANLKEFQTELSLPIASEASPQTAEACILASHSGGFGSLIRRTPYDG